MRQIALPKLKSDMCTPCRGTGELTTSDGQVIKCPPCRGKGKIKRSVKRLLGNFLDPGQGEGVNIPTMRKNFKILDKIDSCTDGVVYLEDEEWSHLSSRIDKQQWTQNDRGIMAVADAIESAQTIDPKKIPGLNRKGRRALKNK